METLTKLFGGQARVRIMRLFLLNDGPFEIDDVVSHSRVNKANVRKEINMLTNIGFLKIKTITKEGYRGVKKKVSAWELDPMFGHLVAIKEMLINPDILLQDDFVQRFKPAGKIKLLIVSGIFIGDDKSRADVLIVGDKLKKNIIQQVMKNLEAEIGKELNYVVFDSEEFKYRTDMYDKLVCDIIDLPHKKLIDSGQLSTYVSKK
jgi:hypothetical protein